MRLRAQSSPSSPVTPRSLRRSASPSAMLATFGSALAISNAASTPRALSIRQWSGSERAPHRTHVLRALDLRHADSSEAHQVTELREVRRSPRRADVVDAHDDRLW